MEYITQARLQELLGVSRQTLHRWRATGKGPAVVRLAGERGHIRYRQEDVDSWLAARRIAEVSGDA